MSDAFAIPKPEFSTCPSCETQNPYSAQFCKKCGAAADPDSQAVYEGRIKPALDKARNGIFIVGALYVVGGMLMSALSSMQGTGEDVGLIMGVNIALALIHVGLGIWAKKAPLAAAVTAMVLFITVHLVNAILDPATIVQGILIKVIFISVLISAIKAGLEAKKLRYKVS